MSEEGDREPSDKQKGESAKSAPASNRARQLFGHKSGADPWQSEEASETSPAPPTRPAPQSSAPYPRDAQYAPRPISEDAPAADKAAGAPGVSSPSIFSDVDDEAELTKLHPNYKLLMRIVAIFIGLLVLIGGLVLDGALGANDLPIPFGIITGIATLIALFIVIRIPLARYNARGYQISRDRLRVVRGIMWRADTIVPFGRVQHIDVDQGPIERALGLATLTLHTAGSHNASVSLPGLGHELAVQMREEIREHIKRESM